VGGTDYGFRRHSSLCQKFNLGCQPEACAQKKGDVASDAGLRGRKGQKDQLESKLIIGTMTDKGGPPYKDCGVNWGRRKKRCIDRFEARGHVDRGT